MRHVLSIARGDTCYCFLVVARTHTHTHAYIYIHIHTQYTNNVVALCCSLQSLV